MEYIFHYIENLVAPLIVASVFLTLLILLHLFLRWKYKVDHHKTLPSQALFSSLTIIGIVCITVALPISDTVRAQILSLFGILLSGAIALSATTLLSNALAGLMMRGTRNFKLGDFIDMKDYFGRVSEMGLFHVEIQTQDRNLVTLPNLTMITNPLKVLQSSGTIVMTELSLGYDIHHDTIKRLLIEAALQAGLEDPFVYILELKDFSVLYRVSGLLLQTDNIISTRSTLNEEVMVVLHEAGIEIVSPVFENARNVQSQRFIPPTEASPKQNESEPLPETIVFDKADQAGQLQSKKEALAESEQLISELKDLKTKITTDNAKKAVALNIVDLENKRLSIAEEITALTEKLEEDDS